MNGSTNKHVFKNYNQQILPYSFNSDARNEGKRLTKQRTELGQTL